MRIPFEKSIEIEELFDNKKEYLHFQSATKVLDILEINYESKWIKKVRFQLAIPESSTYDKDKIIKFLKVALNVCRDCANGYQIDEGDALNSIEVIKDVIDIIQN